jgi:hypothetical protein
MGLNAQEQNDTITLECTNPENTITYQLNYIRIKYGRYYDNSDVYIKTTGYDNVRYFRVNDQRGYIGKVPYGHFLYSSGIFIQADEGFENTSVPYTERWQFLSPQVSISFAVDNSNYEVYLKQGNSYIKLINCQNLSK